jgi:hypothetical protein
LRASVSSAPPSAAPRRFSFVILGQELSERLVDMAGDFAGALSCRIGLVQQPTAQLRQIREGEELHRGDGSAGRTPMALGIGASPVPDSSARLALEDGAGATSAKKE